MVVMPIEELRQMRPNWAQLHDAGIELLAPGTSVPPHFHDCGEYMFVLEGRATVEVAGERIEVRGGDAILVETGREHSFPLVSEPTVLLAVRDGRQPPFRDIALPEAQPVRAPLFAPKRSVPPAGLAAHEVTLHPDHTFVPEVLRRGADRDLVLRTHPGALGQSQVREVRRLLSEMRRALTLVCFDVTDAEIDTFFYDRVAIANLDTLVPRGLAIGLDPCEPGAANRLELLREHWLPHLRPAHRILCLEFPLRAWTAAELVALFGAMHTLPPAQWAVLLDWDEEVFRADPFRARDIVGALFPWLIGIRCSRDGVEPLRHMFDGMGFQGWIVEV